MIFHQADEQEGEQDARHRCGDAQRDKHFIPVVKSLYRKEHLVGWAGQHIKQKNKNILFFQRKQRRYSCDIQPQPPTHQYCEQAPQQENGRNVGKQIVLKIESCPHQRSGKAERRNNGYNSQPEGEVVEQAIFFFGQDSSKDWRCDQADALQ